MIADPYMLTRHILTTIISETPSGSYKSVKWKCLDDNTIQISHTLKKNDDYFTDYSTLVHSPIQAATEILYWTEDMP